MSLLDAGLLELLRCPVTGQRLQPVTDAPWPGFCPPGEVGKLDGFLVSEDGTRAYPIRDGIPDLLPESGWVREPR